MSSFRELLEQRAQLDAQIAAARASQRREALAQIRLTMAEYGITAAELDGRLGLHRVPRSKTVARYLNPETGATWSGRGRMPRWLVGRDREAYRLVRPVIPDVPGAQPGQRREDGPTKRVGPAET